jgi:hypothetical protein
MSVHDVDSNYVAPSLTLELRPGNNGIASRGLWVGKGPTSNNHCTIQTCIAAKQKEFVRGRPRFVANPDMRPRFEVGFVPHDTLPVEFNPLPLDIESAEQAPLDDPPAATL